MENNIINIFDNHRCDESKTIYEAIVEKQLVNSIHRYKIEIKY